MIIRRNRMRKRLLIRIFPILQLISTLNPLTMMQHNLLHPEDLPEIEDQTTPEV